MRRFASSYSSSRCFTDFERVCRRARCASDTGSSLCALPRRPVASRGRRFITTIFLDANAMWTLDLDTEAPTTLAAWRNSTRGTELDWFFMSLTPLSRCFFWSHMTHMRHICRATK